MATVGQDRAHCRARAPQYGQHINQQGRVSQLDKNSLWRGLSKPSPTEQGKGTAVLPEPLCRDTRRVHSMTQKPSLCPPATHPREVLCPQGSVPAVHGASCAPGRALALAVGRGAEREVVTEQEQGVEALEPLQRPRQQRDGDHGSCRGEVCHQLLKARNPPQQLRHQPQLQSHVAEVLHTVQGRVQQEGQRLHQGMGQLCYGETWGRQHREGGLGHILAEQEKGKENSLQPQALLGG